MKLHVNDLIVCKLEEARYFAGIISKVAYANEEDWQNEKPLFIHINGEPEDIYISALEGKQVCVVPSYKVDEFMIEASKQYQ